MFQGDLKIRSCLRSLREVLREVLEFSKPNWRAWKIKNWTFCSWVHKSSFGKTCIMQMHFGGFSVHEYHYTAHVMRSDRFWDLQLLTKRSFSCHFGSEFDPELWRGNFHTSYHHLSLWLTFLIISGSRLLITCY